MSDETREEPAFVQAAAEVAGQEAVSSRYYRLLLRCPAVARVAQPGQFVLVACQPDAPGACDPLLPRPMALLDADPRSGILQFLYFVAGRGTELLQKTAASAHGGRPVTLRLIGPLGRGFEALPGADAHVGVGGGSGVSPLVFFFRRLPASAAGPRHLILAARTRDHLARGDVVAAPGAQVHEATDDGSAGFHGHAVAALAKLLDGPLRGRRAALYVAGPEAMMLAAVELARARALPIRVSLEARMACGVGVCRACVVDGRRPHPKTGLLRRAVCHDGPVFDPDELAPPWGRA
jgi:dihydroorotate dehydrogenase electron transfer subunit